MNSLVSIIVPVYNKEKHLNKCIDSILCQTYIYFELIIVDDGSTDASKDIIMNYSDSRIQYFSKNNSGVSDTRNVGLDHAKGKYVFFIDSDDYIEHNYIETFMNQGDFDFICQGYNLIYHDSNKRIKSHMNCYLGLKETIPREFYSLGYCHSVWGKRYRMDIIRLHEISFKHINISEDSFFNINYMSHINDIMISNYCGYNYVQYHNENNLTSICSMEYLNIYSDLYNEYKNIVSDTIAQEIIYPQYYNLIMRIVKSYSLQEIKKSSTINNAICNDDFISIFKNHKSNGFEKIFNYLMRRHHWAILKFLINLLKLKWGKE